MGRVVEDEKTIWGGVRRLYFRSTDLTHGFQGEPSPRLVRFYAWWSRFYDLSVLIDPAYARGLKRMVELVVRPGDVTLDVGCGTGLATLRAAGIAQRVVGVDMSAEMLARLETKARRRTRTNIETVCGPYPDAIDADRRFDSIISSFAIVHFPVELRRATYQALHDHLSAGGRLGLFAAQGEGASSFETRDETIAHLETAGFEHIVVRDVADIYRIVTARRP